MADLSNLGLGTSNPFLGTGNPYLQQTIDAASGDLVRNWNLAQAPAFNAAQVRSGSYGNSAIDQLTREGQGQLQRNLGDVAAKMRSQDYANQQQEYNWQKQFDDTNNQWNLGFDRNVFNDAYSQNMNNLQTGIGLLGTLGGYNA